MENKNIRFSEHAKIKFDILRKHGLNLDEKMIIDIIYSHEHIFKGYSGRMIAQGNLDENRVLRVVYEDKPEENLIVTFYPGKKERYEKS